jgi:hypothetical protein
MAKRKSELGAIIKFFRTASPELAREGLLVARDTVNERKDMASKSTVSRKPQPVADKTA